jgi:hypothetical protein
VNSLTARAAATLVACLFVRYTLSQVGLVTADSPFADFDSPRPPQDKVIGAAPSTGTPTPVTTRAPTRYAHPFDQPTGATPPPHPAAHEPVVPVIRSDEDPTP